MERWRLRWAFSVPSDLGFCWWVHRWAQTPPGWRSVCVGSVCTLPQPIPGLIPLGLSGPVLGQEENRAWSNAAKTHNAGVAWLRLAAMLGPGLSHCALTPEVPFQHGNCSHQLPLPEGAGGWKGGGGVRQHHKYMHSVKPPWGWRGSGGAGAAVPTVARQHWSTSTFCCLAVSVSWGSSQRHLAASLGEGWNKDRRDAAAHRDSTSGCSVLVMCPCFLMPAGPQHPALPHRHPGSERD